VPFVAWKGVYESPYQARRIVALLVTLSLRAQFAMEHPNWSGSTTWGMAIITGLLFFVSLLWHELSHAAVGSPVLAKESERIYGLFTRLLRRLRRKKKKDEEIEEAEV